ncbi:glycosyltransferase family 87 protein [Tuwongella immobilis]|uniref:DUF2029 domain-containing protein n=1 Tax=Tuwongella immobilis TaxID=692036 RepID=A0A6C2YN20_9BACT|nr:glycosyltransferase family 87 protein [Tuwongella immobilis]VIP02609.1 membrane protein : Uncharacterized protein OS=Pseudonocardia dioxanivorans (strain ATCC 55486 / DSM 44775 / JCM 13855 / CB1190) GN=Psed_1724 PE=4 SV=1: DUF2029 [Tuwongella immobilis]VTS01915.1 membrane protein : Uncharacterized protein OS=Pseudonocardia dioxanivorans (strain ATCC 55486 / DSM 44775 / JCM 13855 / CB1190) GN=Psed_1724 PE=4 SV=1: DUF2029 [Tuwongella immobilis]
MNPNLIWLAGYVLHPITRAVAAWLLVVAVATGQWVHARYQAFEDWRSPDDPERRVDGNHGHTTIDFGGQWLMGRMLTSGNIERLYHRDIQWLVLSRAMPRSQESPTAVDHDVELLMQACIGQDDPERPAIVAGTLAVLAGSPIAPVTIGLGLPPITKAVSKSLTLASVDRLQHPPLPFNRGGPLYPPLQAFLMAPLAQSDHPQWAYFTLQWCILGFGLLAGLGISVLSRGQIWWSVATLLILVFPGFRGSLQLGQNPALSLLLLVWGWVFLTRGRPIVGGIVWGCLAFKPVWAVSFLLMPLLLRQWKFLAAMCVTGGSLVLLTLPVTGIGVWKEWLAVGSLASSLYDVDYNWVHLSRDLFGIPRRFLLDWEIPRDDRNTWVANVASWGLWLLIFDATIRIYLPGCRFRQSGGYASDSRFAHRSHTLPLIGPLPAFLAFACWLLCYHFMYYDALLSLFGFVLLLANWKSWLVPVRLRFDSPTANSPHILLNSWVVTILGLMILLECLLYGLKAEATLLAHHFDRIQTLPDGSTKLWTPTLHIGTDYLYPWETIGVLLMWGWCAVRLLTGDSDADRKNRSDCQIESSEKSRESGR